MIVTFLSLQRDENSWEMGHSCGSDLIPGQELPHAMGVAIKERKKEGTKEGRKEIPPWFYHSSKVNDTSHIDGSSYKHFQELI